METTTAVKFLGLKDASCDKGQMHLKIDAMICWFWLIWCTVNPW